MADLPPLPAGFTLDSAPSAATALPPLPEGFKLDAPAATSNAGAPPPTAAQHASDVASIAIQHPFTAGVGMAENALSGLTGGVGSLADAVTGSEPGTHDWAYRPHTEAGQAIARASNQETDALGRAYSAVAGQGPLAETIKRYGPEALGAIGTVAGLAELPKGVAALRSPEVAMTAQDVVDRTAAASPQNQGAAAASPRVNAATPELQQAIVQTARKNGGVVNPEVLQRHLEADSLPVKVDLTAGQATQDPVLISNERNLRGKHQELAHHFDTQNDQLNQNVQAIRDTVGPDVFTTNPVEHADTLIKSYQDVDAARNADINQKYQALRDAAGGNFPVDARTLLTNVKDQLGKQLLTHDAPPSVMNTLTEMADKGQMTFEQFESLRTNLARIQRSISDNGNVRAAAGLIRDQMEQLPLEPGAANLKPLADSARAAAKERFQALEQDPAYKAAVTGSVDPDKFVRKFVINGSRDDVATMKATLKDDPTATQTVAVAVLDHLREAAGLSPDYQGNFSQARFNKALRSLDPKLQSLVDPQTAEHLQTLANVANYTQFQPKGAYVNNSNTFTAGAAKYGAGALEGAANVAAHGVPVGTWTRQALEKASSRKAVRASLSPGAGLGQLDEAAANARTRDMLMRNRRAP